MKKNNNSGVTLIELIVSFTIVGIAIIYFFQTLYTVKKIYNTSKKETNNFVNKNYTLRIIDSFFNKNNYLDDLVCENYDLQCESISDETYYYEIYMKDGSSIVFYKYSNFHIIDSDDHINDYGDNEEYNDYDYEEEYNDYEEYYEEDNEEVDY